MQIFVLYFKMFTGHNNILYGGLRNFLNKNGLYKNVCNVIGLLKIENIENMSMGMTSRRHKALQLLYFYSFVMKQYIRINPDV